MHTLMRITPLALAALAGTALAAPTTPDDGADVQALANQLEQLKANYAQEVRRLRELDMQVQAMQARLGGRVGPASTPPAAPLAQAAAAAAPPSSEGYASTAAEAQQARQESRRSVDDVKQQQSALFSRRFTIENSLTYARYDRKQLTLNGFLALDAIFLGNIAIENVESDSLTYNVAARWGVSPNLTLNLDVPYLARRTVYQKGGAGGAAAAIAQEQTNGNGLGDIGLSANYRLFGERGWRPETVLTAGVTAPTGRAPYGLDWKVIERDDDDYIRFAVPREQPTGNGVWQANLGLSMVKTADFSDRDDVASCWGTAVVTVHACVLPRQHPRDNGRIVRYRQAAAGKAGQVRRQPGCGVERRETEPPVELDDVSARREVGEFETGLGEDRPDQAEAVGAVILEHAERREIAEPAQFAVELAF